MSYTLIDAIVEEHNRQEAIRSGEPAWEAGDSPDPYGNDWDGPPHQEHFFAYGMGLGLGPDTLKAEWEQQVKAGGDPRRHFVEKANGTVPAGAAG